MPRADLTALTIADLEALANRGIVKRSQREVEAAEVAVDETADGTVTVAWPDGITTMLPGGKTVRDARCTCAATTLCRHVVQTVLAYQRHAAKQPSAPAVVGPWDPGAFTDADLERLFAKPRLAVAQRRRDQGLLVDLVRGVKPLARFEDDQCCLRFLVPGDARYVHCDCAEPAPCGHVPLAVWAFRALDADKPSGLVALGWKDAAVPSDWLDEVESTVREAFGWGLRGLDRNWRDRLARLEERGRAIGLVWPADIVLEILGQFDAYHAHDARFAPDRFARLIGELLIRIDAIRADTGAAPQAWIRGSLNDRVTEIGTARFVGIGCGVSIERRRVRLTSFLQDIDSGSLVAIDREFPDPAADSPDLPKSFAQLGTALVGGVPLAGFAGGQLLTRGAKRSPSHRLTLPRGKVHSMPQGFAWEKLRAPLLAEDFAEIIARLTAGVPALLRPRRLTEGLAVVPIAGVVSAAFDPIRQIVEAQLRDSRGDSAYLRHPYLSRGRDGAESLLALLSTRPESIRFVAGHVSLVSGNLEIRPICVVHDPAGNRQGLLPWVAASSDVAGPIATPGTSSMPPHPLAQFQTAALDALGQSLVVGIRRPDDSLRMIWGNIAAETERLGLVQLGKGPTAVTANLTRGQNSLAWDWSSAAAELANLVPLLVLSESIPIP